MIGVSDSIVRGAWDRVGGGIYKIPTLHFLTRILRNTQSYNAIIDWVCWEFQNSGLWDSL